MKTVDYKCPACSAPLKYNAGLKKWKCEYCASEYNLEDLSKNEEKYNKAEVKTRKMDVDEYTCSNCGAKIITDENTSATFCVYCGSSSIIKNRLLGIYEPKKIIPFKTTKEQAIEAFKKCKKGKLFAPKEFAMQEQIEKITGVYIPFWLYDCNLTGDIECRGEKVTSWISGDYKYIKTDVYSIIRGGKAFFDDVPVDASVKFDDDTMDSIEPFDFKEFEDFSPAYLSGFLAEKYDVEEDIAYNRALERVKNTFRTKLKEDIIMYNTVQLKNEDFNIDRNKADYVLLPVWMLNIKYKDKMHTFAMNGQTGKMVGDIPVSKLKAFLFGIAVFAGSFAILSIINLLLF